MDLFTPLRLSDDPSMKDLINEAARLNRERAQRLRSLRFNLRQQLQLELRSRGF